MSDTKSYEAMTPQEQMSLVKKLNILIMNGADCIDAAQTIIKNSKAPYIIIESTVPKCHPEASMVEGMCSMCAKSTSGNTQPKWELRSELSIGELWLQKFITHDDDTKRMKLDALKMSDTPHEVLVEGETGTGKELIAKSQIGKKKGSIKSVNCAGLPRELIESELFGYVQGAFTGALKNTNGLITEAANGILFMDEVSELPLDMQAKLLRVIQEKTVRKVGGKSEDKIECKFVFASNKSLHKMVKSGQFRADLYARISPLKLKIKPLRDRMCDIYPIVMSLPGGQEFWKEYGSSLLDGRIELPYNVRSLQHYVIQYSVLGRIDVDVDE